MKKSMMILCAMLLVFGFARMAQAILYDRGGGLIYDSDQDITWLQDANYAGETMTWNRAFSWAELLSYYDSVRGVTWDDWRLPTTVDGPEVYGYDGTTTRGFNITSSEMGYMYYENLGNLGYYDISGSGPQPGWGLNNTSPFINLQPGYYWSGTEYAAAPGAGYAWVFHFNDGGQGYGRYGQYAWAVRDGDVGAPVPEPSTMLLLGTGLIGLAGWGRKKFKK